MSFVEVTISDADVKRLFDRLQSPATGEAVMDALHAAAKVVRRNAQTELVRKHPGAATTRHRGAFRNNGAPVDNILYHLDERKRSVNINIMRDARLRWFEAGTIDRMTEQRNPAYRGRITTGFFFSESYANSAAEIEQVMLQSLDQYFKNLDY
ncbi:hypothetical protein [Duncaniella muris]|uniref:hypothetical protein n=1 Tax=Duncaniella muris TaxID=2094150 RepID=UPI00267462F5|nr:hypothetical protein [Duncaniella muris]